MDLDASPPPFDDGLDRALAAALRAPALPPGFHRELLARLDADAPEAPRALAVDRRRLEQERLRDLRELRADYVLLRVDTVLTLIAVAFTVGAALDVALPMLARWAGVDVTVLGFGMAAVAVAAVSFWVLARRLGWLEAGEG